MFVFSVTFSSCTLISMSFYLLSFIPSRSFLQLLCVQRSIFVLKKGVFLGQKGRGPEYFLGPRPQTLLFLSYPLVHGLLRFFQLEPPLKVTPWSFKNSLRIILGS